jgi:MFS family permease
MSAQLEPSVDRGSRPLVVTALAVTQTVGYGVLYYVFGVFLGPMSADLGISTATSAGALTLAILLSCVMSVPVGRWLDRRGAHLLMTSGSLLASIAVLLWSQVQNVAQLYLVFALIGIASAMVLYGPAIAVLVAVLEPKRRTNALLVVTLVAGLASTIFIPLAGQLMRTHGWREAF